MYALRSLKNILNTSHLLILYYSLVYPYLDYGLALWGSTHSTIVNSVFIKQKKAIRIVARATYNEHSSPLFKQLNMQVQVAKYMLSMSKGTLPLALVNHITFNTDIHTHDTRNKNNLHITQRRTVIASKSLRHKGPAIWYSIPSEIRIKNTFKSFNNTFKCFNNNLKIIYMYIKQRIAKACQIIDPYHYLSSPKFWRKQYI